jgi:hypothetical protein
VVPAVMPYLPEVMNGQGNRTPDAPCSVP